MGAENQQRRYSVDRYSRRRPPALRPSDRPLHHPHPRQFRPAIALYTYPGRRSRRHALRGHSTRYIGARPAFAPRVDARRVGRQGHALDAEQYQYQPSAARLPRAAVDRYPRGPRCVRYQGRLDVSHRARPEILEPLHPGHHRGCRPQHVGVGRQPPLQCQGRLRPRGTCIQLPHHRLRRARRPHRRYIQPALDGRAARRRHPCRQPVGRDPHRPRQGRLCPV